MSPELRSIIVTFGILLGIGLVTAVHAEEGVFLNPDTGNYTIRYHGYGDVLVESTFYSHNNIDPHVRSIFRHSDDGSILYRYKVRNGRNSKQNLTSLRVTTPQVVTNSQNVPPGWHAETQLISTSNPIYGDLGYFVSWGFVSNLASKAGISIKGLVPSAGQEFEFRSPLLPGTGIMSLRGSAPVTEFPDEGPDPTSMVGIALSKLEHNDFATRNIAAPRIPNPAPYNALVVLAGIQKHLDTDIVSMKLVDPVLVTDLDRWLGAAITAAGQGNTQALRASLQEARKLLKQEHQDLDKDDDLDEDDKPTQIKPRIDKLAARALDFDLRYVENRIKDE